MKCFPDNCYGCGVCVSVCPVNAVSLSLSDKGFWLPSVDSGRCTGCNLCDKVCGFNDDKIAMQDAPQNSVYAMWLKDADKLKSAASGGAGTAIAELLVSQGWGAVGVTYDAKTDTARHVKVTSVDALRTIANSKYLQSYSVDGFDGLFDGGKYVVFGAPCQIDSLRRMIRLKQAQERFILVDFFCHGVPSYLLWFAYLKHKLSGQEKLLDARFRDKKNGWHIYTLALTTTCRTIFSTATGGDWFFQLFLGRCVMNQPCYQCKYRGVLASAADIRIGDFWGNRYADNNSGVSRVVGLTRAGDAVIGELAGQVELVRLDEAILADWGKPGRVSIPKERNNILSQLAAGKSLRLIVWRRTGTAWLRKLLPTNLKQKIKQIVGK